MNHIVKFAPLAILLAAASPALAQGMGMQGGGMHGDMPMKGMGMMGMHAMSGTVTNVDSQTGMVDLDAAGHALKLHFPPASLAGVKSGDKITVRMSFSKS